MGPLDFLAALVAGSRPEPEGLGSADRSQVAAWLAKPKEELARALGVAPGDLAHLAAAAAELGLLAQTAPDQGELRPAPRRPGPPRGTPPPQMHGAVLAALLGGAGKGPRGIREALERPGDGAEPRLDADPGLGLSEALVAALAERGTVTLGQLARTDPLDLIGIGGLRYSGASKLVGLARRRLGAASPSAGATS